MSSHPQAGKWEMPSGHIEENESPQQAAIREWEEEVGLVLPPGEIVGKWDSSNGRYVGFVYEIEHEADLDLHERDRSANRDGDHFEAVAWVDPVDLHNHNLRHELMDDLGRVQGVLVKNSEEEHQGIYHPPAIDLPKYRVSHTTIAPSHSEYLESLGIHPHHLLYYSGIPHHLEVERHYIGEYGGKVISDVDSPHYTMNRHFDLPRRTVHNESFETADTGTGLGSEIFSNQVANLSRHGFHTIKAYAVKGMGYNGHYTWPRLGYNATFNLDEKERLPEQWQHIDTIQQLYRTPERREWWKHHGWSKEMEFDLRPNSLSHQIHKAYMEERARREPTENSLISVEDIRRHKEPKVERIDLAPWEEEALDRAWKRIDQEGYNPTSNAKKDKLPKYNVGISNLDRTAMQHLKKGAITSQHHLLHVLGLPPELPIDKHEVGVTDNHVITTLDGPHYNMVHLLAPYHKTVHIAYYRSHKPGGGLGSDILTNHVKRLTDLGYHHIKLTAMRSPSMTGYRFWPAVGFNAPFSEEEKGKLPERYKKAETVQHLFSIKGGRQWWRDNGRSKSMTFDLHPGSESHRILDEYNEERAKVK